MRLLWFIALIIFTMQPAQAPQRDGTAKRHRTQTATQANNTHNKTQPPNQTAPVSAQTSVGPEHQAIGGNDNALTCNNNKNAPKPNGDSEWKMAIFTGILACVGVLQLVVMAFTLCVYQRQAREMRRQRHEMRHQRHFMWRQLKTMQGQLGQMESAGKQTEHLINHASGQVQAALDNAVAAKSNADAVLNSERPWVVVQCIPSSSGNNYTFQASNYGRTPAEIVRSHGTYDEFDDELAVPLLSPKDVQSYLVHKKLLLPLRDLITVQTGVTVRERVNYSHYIWDYSHDDVFRMKSPDAQQAIKLEKKKILVYGVVVYNDILAKQEHYTRFCYWWNPAGSGSLIVGGPQGANEHT
jgi:hypothetical protein